MAFQPFQATYGGTNEPYAGQQQPLYDQQQAVQFAPPDTLNTSFAHHANVPPLPDQQALYDPFSHAEDLQYSAATLEASEAPPLPLEDAPPLPTEVAPPLPTEPAEQQHIFAPLPELSPAVQQPQPAPAYQASDVAYSGGGQQPVYQFDSSQAQQQAPPSAWQTYQYPGAYAYQQSQQASWYPDLYSHQHQTYPQPALVQQPQPWHTQHTAPWQQQHQPHVLQQHTLQQPPAYPPPSDPAPAEPDQPLQPVQEAPAKLVTDAVSIFQQPGRASRPKRVAIVLRGLPGSGKSHTAKKLKGIEVQQGGEAPRIHAIDDYFVTVIPLTAPDSRRLV